MKKTFFYSAALLVACTLFVACGDDDEAGSSTATAEDFQITTADGDRVYLKSNGQYTFTYDSDGLLTGWGSYTVSYNPMTIKYKYDDDEDETMTVSLNGSGYVSSINVTYYESYDDDYSYSESIKWNFSYNSNGQLSSISWSGSGVEIDDGKKYTYSGSGSGALEYSNGVLKSVALKESWKGDESYSVTEKYTYTYGSTAVENVTGQHTYSLVGALYDFDLECLCFVGLFGKASYELPSQVEHYYYDGLDDYEGTSTTSYSYTFNSNGTIKTEKVGSKTYSYSYYAADDIISTRASVADAGVTIDGSMVKPKRLFRAFLEKAKAKRTRQQ